MRPDEPVSSSKEPEVPPAFDIAFLDWFRDGTEAFWASLPIRTPDEILAGFVQAGVGGSVWQHGTRWLTGLDEEEIARAEAHWGLRFPPDHRLFLQRLHAPDRPQLRAVFDGTPDPECDLARATSATGSEVALREASSFCNWSTDSDDPRRAFEWLVEGLAFDVHNNTLWLPSWGEKPSAREQQTARVRALVEQAPKLVPVYRHRYLLAEPCAAGNPVLSVWQSDIVVYGSNLREYFLAEFRDLLGVTDRGVGWSLPEYPDELYERDRRIPFWGALLELSARGQRA